MNYDAKTKNRSPSDMVCITQAKTGFKSALVFPRSPPCLDFSAEFLLVICLPSLTCKNATFSFASRRYIVGLYLCWWVFDIMKVYLSGSVSSAIACPTDVMKIRMQARLTKLIYVNLSAIEMIKTYSTNMIHHRILYFPGQQMTIWAPCELGWTSTKRRAYGVFGGGWDKKL